MDDIICVRGGGDLATGVVQKLWRAGLKVFVLEISQPTSIRRTVALSTAVYEGTQTVEDVTAKFARTPGDFADIWRQNAVPVLIDPLGECIRELLPGAVVDAIIAKHNLGMRRGLAPVTIALGPGFTAPRDADAVIETMRGHDLGRMILHGSARADTGTPGEIGGKTRERVLHAPRDGTAQVFCDIGTPVAEGQNVCAVDGAELAAPFDGIVRGMIRPGLWVHVGMKIGDIDPRRDTDYRSISDKARCIGGAVLEAYLYLKRRRQQ